MQTSAVDSSISSFEATRIVSVPSKPNAGAANWASEMHAVAQSRDRASFMRIYDYFVPRLLRYLQGLGCAEMVAEELAQEAMLRLWQRAASYDAQRSQVSTWLFRVARNLYIDRVRREPHWIEAQEWIEQLDSEAGVPNVLPVQVSPDAFAEHRALQQRVDKLPATQARLVRMSYFEARTHQEISAELGMPLGTVKSHLRRAFLKLQIAIGKSS